ncbi:MAG: DoxX-like family protein [Isosphaeraceae bacterium]
MDDLWRLTQTPGLHRRWDLRFSDIEYLPRLDETEPQRFLYATRVGFGLSIRGEGESVGTREEDGARTSALKFWSRDPKSLISTGAGYWKYIPAGEGVRFLTRYDYQTRFGSVGRAFDAAVFRPLMGWATAWSFDRLRLWLEDGIDPATSAALSLIHAAARGVLGFIWIYQGVFPKLVFQDSGEVDILRASGLVTGLESRVLTLVGVAEVLFGVFFLALGRTRSLYLVNAVVLVALALGAAFSQPRLLVAPFNPVTLNLAMLGLGLAGYLASFHLPTSRRCARRPEGGEP